MSKYYKSLQLRVVRAILVFFLLSGVHFGVRAQPIERFNTFSYGVNEGLLQSTIAGMAFDKNNFCWISYPNGLQKFDGDNFTDIKIQPGLPDNRVVRFLRLRNDDLLFSHSQGISKYEINNNRFVQIYKQASTFQTSPLFIGEDDGIVYFYDESGTVTGVKSGTFKVVTKIKTGFHDRGYDLENYPKFSDNIINHKVAIWINMQLCLWDLAKGNLVYRSETIPDRSQFFLRLKSEYEALYTDYKSNNALQCHNFITGKNRVLIVQGKDDLEIGRCTVYPWHNKLLISFSNKLYETDSTLQVLKSELVNFQNQSPAGNQGIAHIKEDNFGNLYLQTISGGIRKIIRNNYPIKYYGTLERENNFVVSVLPDKKNNRILVGTTRGLLIFDTLQRLARHIKSLPGSDLPFSPSIILKTNKGNYQLYNSGHEIVWELSQDLTIMKKIPLSTLLPANKSGIGYFGKLLFQDEKEAIIQSQELIYRTSFVTNIISEQVITNGYTMSGLYYDNKVITHANDELIFLDAATFKELKRVSFKNTGYVRCFARDAANKIYVGSNNGIFIIDSSGKTLVHLNKESGLQDECIYSMHVDRNNFVWYSSNKGLFRISSNNNLLQLTKEDGLQENEFNTNVMAETEDGELYFGGINGVSSFYPSAISSHNEKIDLVVTQIKVNNENILIDTAAWNIDNMELSYNQNSLAFDFVAMANNNPGQYTYQYLMEGIDKAWIQNNDLQTVRYFLPPGDYVFKIYASRFFDKDAVPMKEIRITIHPPFWKTWWFLTGLAGIFVAAMTYTINQFNKRKYKKKLAELETEHKVQLERERISRDLHDSIGAYANAVLYNTELLEKEDEEKLRRELMKDVRFASKDIITALRETIWALKKDSYSAEDCLVRIRNFIQPFNRYYQHIHFKLEEKETISKKLHYTKALNVVRIAQEAVTNAIKHSGAKNITIVSSSNDGKWELAIADDGKGFENQTWEGAEQGDGLSNMKKRAADSGFDLRLEQSKTGGTRVSLLIS